MADEVAKARGWTKTLAVRRALERAVQEGDVEQALKAMDAVIAVPTLPARKGALESALEKIGLTTTAETAPRWVRVPFQHGWSAWEPKRHVRKRLYTTSEAAEYMGCEDKNIEELAARGQLRAVVIAEDCRRWDVYDLDALIEAWKSPAEPTGETVQEGEEKE